MAPARKRPVLGLRRFCIDFDADDEGQIETTLKESGEQGWELATVNSNNGIHCLKRPQ
jgi:hypothetical protein